MMNPDDTIIACATPTGYSSIALLRLSGDQAIPLVRKIFSPVDNIQDFLPGRAYYGQLIHPDTGQIIDYGLATFFIAPHSYTGEDVVEISCHGNPLIVEKIIKIFTEVGARLAQPGEFTRRALLNGKIDLLQAEAVLDIVQARCDKARDLAIAQYEGRLSERIGELRNRIIAILAIVEANIDFPEEDDVYFNSNEMAAAIKELIAKIDELLAGAENGIKIKEGYTVLIIGRPNVGKSTIFNRFLGYERAIVHEVPGTTRDYIEEGLEVNGLFIRLIDTAGIYSGATGIDQLAAERSRALIKLADLILMVFDGSEPLNEQDIELYNLIKNKRRILIVNKIDLNIKLKEPEILSDAIKLSAKTGDNFSVLKENITKVLNPIFNNQETILTKFRHIQLLKDVRACVANIEEDGLGLEKVAFELHTALNLIGELTGKVLRKEILDKIFEEFCIGK